KIAEEVVDPDDIEMLEDLIMAAANEALREMETDAQNQLSKYSAGLGGGFGF
ncbi:MAG: YbaB/EbfC family nucleoid-associated protein, partial [Clostridiales bacterium]|nr:YbaB/EbfC family nucleoid-associated protein [Clostridiales bacterium]